MRILILFCCFCLFLISCDSSPEKGPRVRCASNLKQIYFALEAYASDNNGSYPNKNDFLGLKMLVDGHYLKASFLKCPADKGKTKCSYRFLGGLSKNTDKNVPVCWDKKNNHKYRNNTYGNVLYLDGHIEGYSLNGPPPIK